MNALQEIPTFTPCKPSTTRLLSEKMPVVDVATVQTHAGQMRACSLTMLSKASNALKGIFDFSTQIKEA